MTQDSYPDFPVKVFIDSNVVLECLPLAELPWQDVDSTGPILVLLSHSTLREIDSKKQAGRLSQYARAFNRLIAPIAEHGAPVLVTEGPPRVCVMAAQSDRIDWDQYDDLNREDADTRIVAEILHARGVPEASRLYLSQDANALIVAGGHGLRTKRVPDHWLRPPESPEKDKEIRKLKERVAVLEKAEPSFAIEMALPTTPITVYAVEPLPPAEVEALIELVLRENPQPKQEPDILSHLNFDHKLGRRYSEYETKRVPAFAREIHRTLELYFGQVPFSLTVTNTGSVRADRLKIDISVAGGWINAKPILPMTRGPVPPRPEPFNLPHHLANSGAFKFPTSGVSNDTHEVLYENPKRTTSFSVRCQDFRHGQAWTFSGIVWIDPHYVKATVVNVRVTAANRHGDEQEHFALRKTVFAVKPSDLVELGSGKLQRDAHITPLVNSFLQNKDYKRIEFDNADYES